MSAAVSRIHRNQCQCGCGSHLFDFPSRGTGTEKAETVAWWRGNEVAVAPQGRGLRLFGSSWTSTKPMPPGVVIDSRTGNFRVNVGMEEHFEDVRWHIDRHVPDGASWGRAGAGFVSAESTHTDPVVLRTCEPNPAPERTSYQFVGGKDRPAEPADTFVWTRLRGLVRGVCVEVWFDDPAGWSWITFRPRSIAGVTGQGIIGTVADVSANPIRAAWVPTETVTVTGAIERRWSNQLPSYLPQGAYGSVDGTIFSMSPTSDPETIELRTWGPYAPRSRHFHYSGSFGWETVPVSTVESRVEVRTTASLAGHLVSVARPASEIASSARVAVVGQGPAPDDLVLADGDRPMVTVRDDGSWGTSVGRFHLDDLEVEFV